MRWEQPSDARSRTPVDVREPLANRGAVAAARARPMSQRLELALSWNAVAAELQAQVAGDRRPTARR